MKDEFEAWVHARSGALGRSAFLLVGDAQLAEDLVQETLERVAQNWERVLRRGDPTAYAQKVLHNLAIDGWRRRRRRPAEVGGSPVERTHASYEGGEIERRLVLSDALGRLTPKQRAVLILRYYDDLSESQTAALLGCSPNTVKSQASQALVRLRNLAPEVLAEFETNEAGR